MRVLCAVIYTDKLNEVRDFYQKHFTNLLMEIDTDRAFDIIVLGEARITFVDAKKAGVAPSQNVLIRIGEAFPVLEHGRLIASGAPCGDLIVEDWGPHYGKAVQYFITTDPSGTRLQFFENRFGEAKQLMTTGDGRGTREVQKEHEAQ